MVKLALRLWLLLMAILANWRSHVIFLFLKQFETWRGTVIDSKVLWVMGISSNALDGCTGLTSMSIDMK